MGKFEPPKVTTAEREASMTQINKINMPLVMVGGLLVMTATVVANYYASREAVHDAFNELKTETRTEIANLKAQDRIHDFQLASLEGAVKAATTYVSTGIVPDKTK